MRETGRRILLVGALATLALAVNHFLFHWVLFTDAQLHRDLFRGF